MLCVFRSSWYIDQEDTLWVEASTTPITQYTWSSLVKRRRVGRTTEYWYLRYLSYRTYCYTCVTVFANDIASSAATMALVILSCSLPDRSVFGGRSGLMPFEGSLRPLVQQVEATRVADGLVISKSSTHTSTSGAAICFSNLQAFNVSQVIRSTSHNARLVCCSPPLQPSAAISTGQHCVKMVHHSITTFYHNVKDIFLYYRLVRSMRHLLGSVYVIFQLTQKFERKDSDYQLERFKVRHVLSWSGKSKRENNHIFWEENLFRWFIIRERHNFWKWSTVWMKKKRLYHSRNGNGTGLGFTRAVYNCLWTWQVKGLAKWL